MKIGILTYHTAHNYGAALQAFGLQQRLIQLGHEVKFVNFYPYDVEDKNNRKVRGYGLKSIFKRLAFKFFSGALKKRANQFNSFRAEFLHETTRYLTFEELNKNPPEVDAYVCGSDQIWNLRSGGSPVYFMQFNTEGKRLISYAASIGSAKINKEYESKVKNWLEKFNHISCRERQLSEELHRMLGRAVTQVLDPIFLLEREEWNKLVKAPKLKGDYIAFYSLEVTPLVAKTVRHLSKHLNCHVVVLGKPDISLFGSKVEMAIDSGPLEFVSWIKHARFVVTNSFHATAFSVMFHKPFITVKHSLRNARMESLLELLGLEDRIIGSLDELQKMEDLQQIDWTKLQSLLDQQIHLSNNFIIDSLK